MPVGVSVSPIIPFINEPELERVLEAARDGRRRAAFSIVLRLPWEVNPLFQQWLQTHFPDRAARVMARVRDMRGGRDYDAALRQAHDRRRASGRELLRQRFAQGPARARPDRDQRPALDFVAVPAARHAAGEPRKAALF